jgi:hypothetical protein
VLPVREEMDLEMVDQYILSFLFSLYSGRTTGVIKEILVMY